MPKPNLPLKAQDRNANLAHSARNIRNPAAGFKFYRLRCRTAI
nr:hypothetical protein [uncultured Campylobacter sp.]